MSAQSTASAIGSDTSDSEFAKPRASPRVRALMGPAGRAAAVADLRRDVAIRAAQRGRRREPPGQMRFLMVMRGSGGTTASLRPEPAGGQVVAQAAPAARGLARPGALR